MDFFIMQFLLTSFLIHGYWLANQGKKGIEKVIENAQF